MQICIYVGTTEHAIFQWESATLMRRATVSWKRGQENSIIFPANFRFPDVKKLPPPCHCQHNSLSSLGSPKILHSVSNQFVILLSSNETEAEKWPEIFQMPTWDTLPHIILTWLAERNFPNLKSPTQSIDGEARWKGRVLYYFSIWMLE